MKNFLLLSLLISLVSFSQEKTDVAKYGIEESSVSKMNTLKVGDKSPNFDFIIEGRKSDLYALAAEKEVILVFYRGHWCPYCSRHLDKMQKDLKVLSDKGYQVLAVAPQKEEYIDELDENIGLQIPVVADTTYEIMRKFGVAFDVTEDYVAKVDRFVSLDLAAMSGQEKAVLPVPATYVIDKNGLIKFIHFDMNYGKRATVEDILKGLEESGSTK